MDFVEAGLTPVGFLETNILYGLVMFALALLVDKDDFAILLKQRRALTWGLIFQHLMLPVGIIITSLVFYLPIGPSTGLVIVSAMPALALGGLLTWFVRGNVALALLIVGFSTFISALVAPGILELWAQWSPFAAHDAALMQYSAEHTLIVGVGVTLCPVLAAIAMRRLVPSLVRHASKALFLLLIAAMLIPVGLIRNNLGLLSENVLAFAPIIGLIYFSSFLFIYKFSQSLGFLRPDIYCFSFTVCSQNAALAGLYLLSGLGAQSEQVVAGIWWVLFQYYGALLVALFLRKPLRPVQQASE